MSDQSHGGRMRVKSTAVCEERSVQMDEVGKGSSTTTGAREEVRLIG